MKGKEASRKRTLARAPAIGPGERMQVTLALSLMAHGLLLFGVSFNYEEPAATLPSLDVILIEQQTAAAPEKADFLSNANQRGGGDRDKAQRPRSPSSGDPAPDREGRSRKETRQSRPAAQPRPNDTVVTTTGPSDEKTPRADPHPEAPPSPTLSGRELIEQSLESARLAAEVERETELYAKRPKRKFISANTQEFAYASYMRSWVSRVERIGNLNFPDAARQEHLAGDLILAVSIRRDGSVDNVQLKKSSGKKVLDDAAIRIVHLSAPFAPLPKTDENIDILEITRTWQFEKGGTLGTTF